MKTPRLQLTPAHTLLLTATGACTMAVLVMRFLYIPLWGRVQERWTSLATLRVKMADARLSMERLPAEEAALTQAQERRQLLERRIGQEQSIARILEALGRQAKTHHLELVTMQPRADAHEEASVSLGPEIILRDMPLTVELTGRYRQLGEFLGELPSAPYVAAVKRMRITRPDLESPKLKADLVLAVYLAP